MIGSGRKWWIALAATTVLVAGAAPAAAGSGGRAGAAPVTASDVVHAPVRAVHVSWGEIGYRAVGHGSPLVLIMGFAGSIDAWPPGFVAGLAADHRVYALDNEGVGLTTLRPGRLTITRMADDTAAFVRALHLGRPDVLGWSMGGFIAQAYGARHPGMIHGLVLSATAPGDGHAVLPSAAVQGALAAGGAGLVKYLFPPDQAGEVARYEAAIVAYPGFELPTQAVVNAQLGAVARWVAGGDRAGHGLGRLRIPTLIGDGRDDLLLPAANSIRLHSLIAGSRLKLYRDAGHGFLFQDERSWVATILGFLR